MHEYDHQQRTGMPPRHPTARRIHKDQAAPDDAFIARVLELTVWIREHRRAITVGLIAVVLALATGVYYRNSRVAIANRATAELAELRQAVASGNRAVAIQELQTFIGRFGSTSAAAEARLVLGQLYLEEGNPEQAIQTLRSVADDLNHPLGASAAFLVGAAHEAANRSGEAERVYLRVADGAEFPFQRLDALDAAARIRLDRGDFAGAATLYDRILAMLPQDAPERTIYEMRRAEARTRAEAAPTPQS